MHTIGPATAADGRAYLALVDARADHEKLPGRTPVAKAPLLDGAFGERPLYQVWVAELEGAVVAYAATFQTCSTFRARPTLFVEDLLVAPAARRRGVATAVVAHFKKVANQRGCGRFEWAVLDWNVDAQPLHASVGAERLGDWRICRVNL